jgi:hypothetical protein
MGRSHGTALVVREQDRQAVGHHDGARNTGLAGETGVRLLTIRRIVVQLRHDIAMHLSHEHSALLQLKRQQLAVVENRLRVIAHMVAQVEAVIRRQRRPPCPMGAEHLSP